MSIEFENYSQKLYQNKKTTKPTLKKRKLGKKSSKKRWRTNINFDIIGLRVVMGRQEVFCNFIEKV